MKILVTGGAGFIGSNIVEELIKRDYTVRILDNFSTGRRENIAELHKDIELIEGDIRNYETVKKSVKGIDVILHQAALPSVPRSIADPLTTNEVNVGGALNILNAAKESGVKRIVFASSSSVYGDNPELPKHEGMITNPLSPYAVSKLTCEHYLRVFNNLYGIETIALRYFNVFGPKQDPNSPYSAVIPKFIKLITNNQSPTIYGDGTQSRDFTYVTNVVEANILAANTACETPVVMNCSAQNQISLIYLINSINEILGKEIIPNFEKLRQGDIVHSFADITLITQRLNYKVLITFGEGLIKTIEAI
jgi:UDP-glucose 4-epimerase